MFLQERTRWKLAYPPDYRRAFAFSIIPYLYHVVFVSQQTYHLQRWSNTGLPRSVQITGWVRCCLYTGSSTSMCSYLTYLHPGFLPFGQSVPATFTLSRMTVRRGQFKCFHHTIQANSFWNVAIRRVVCSRQLHTRKLLSTHVPVGYS
jgi:hypothetical protein